MATKTHPTTGEAVAEGSEVNNFEAFVDHQRKALAEANKAVMALLPKGVQTHAEAAIKESIEGYRNLVNSTLDDIVKFVQGAKLEEPPQAKEKL